MMDDMSQLYPLRFEPIFRRYLWGGRRLATVLDKPIGEGNDYAESWDVVDHGADQSVIAAGPLAGKTLGELAQEQGPALFGQHNPQKQFPLLWKYLDGQKSLSLQVHPNDAQGAKLDPPDLGKTEAWIIMAAEPGSRLYAGLKSGVDREALGEGLRSGNCEHLLHSFEPEIGDCILIEAGTIHAIGAGLLVGEIQQSSDTTFRLFDWNRLGTDGKPRPLHIDAGLDVIDFEQTEIGPQVPQATDNPSVERLIECDKFMFDRWRFNSTEQVPDDNRFHIMSVVEGSVEVSGDATEGPLKRGDTMVLPAARGSVELRPSEMTVILDAYLPQNA